MASWLGGQLRLLFRGGVSLAQFAYVLFQLFRCDIQLSWRVGLVGQLRLSFRGGSVGERFLGSVCTRPVPTVSL